MLVFALLAGCGTPDEPAPAVPTLLSPASAVDTCLETARFDWAPVEGATAYRVELLDEAERIVHTVELPEPPWMPAAPPGPETRAWQVTALPGAQTAGPEVLALHSRADFEITAPADDAEICGDALLAAWTVAEGASGYRWSVWDADPSQPALGGTTDQASVSVALGPGAWTLEVEPLDAVCDFPEPPTRAVTARVAPPPPALAADPVCPGATSSVTCVTDCDGVEYRFDGGPWSTATDATAAGPGPWLWEARASLAGCTGAVGQVVVEPSGEGGTVWDVLEYAAPDTATTIRDLHGVGEVVWAAGTGNLGPAVWHYEAATASWTESKVPDASRLDAVFVVSVDEVWVAGADDVFRHDGAVWHHELAWGESDYEIEDLLVTGAGHVYAVGDEAREDEDDGFMLWFDGAAWTEVDLGALASERPLRAIREDGAGELVVWAEDDDEGTGWALRGLGSTWSSLGVPDDAEEFNDGWVLDNGHILAAAHDGELWIHDGVSWQLDVDLGDQSWEALWVTSAWSGIAVAASGEIASWDGSSWVIVDDVPGAALYSAYGSGGCQVRVAGAVDGAASVYSN